jgi:hypothetical protein
MLLKYSGDVLLPETRGAENNKDDNVSTAVCGTVVRDVPR